MSTSEENQESISDITASNQPTDCNNEQSPAIIQKPSFEEEFSKKSSLESNDIPATSENVTSSEASSPNQEIYDLSEKAFAAVAEYVRGDLEMTIEDYSVLCEMNRVATKKYADMRQVANEVGKSLTDLNDKYRALQPYLDQIDQLESSVAQLEQAAYRLDTYAKRLENRFKQLEKR